MGRLALCFLVASGLKAVSCVTMKDWYASAKFPADLATMSEIIDMERSRLERAYSANPIYRIYFLPSDTAFESMPELVPMLTSRPYSENLRAQAVKSMAIDVPEGTRISSLPEVAALADKESGMLSAFGTSYKVSMKGENLEVCPTSVGRKAPASCFLVPPKSLHSLDDATVVVLDHLHIPDALGKKINYYKARESMSAH